MEPLKPDKESTDTTRSTSKQEKSAGFFTESLKTSESSPKQVFPDWDILPPGGIINPRQHAGKKL